MCMLQQHVSKREGERGRVCVWGGDILCCQVCFKMFCGEVLVWTEISKAEHLIARSNFDGKKEFMSDTQIKIAPFISYLLHF